jgi:alkanesulfonate monooxygenase SsuD/methylene tetrahydromethanopterin reductase-like flavin-dependent oxidoreductase (luciferase family)
VSGPTLGAIFLPGLPPERLRSVAEPADAAGLEELWLWEDCFRESGIACAAAALAWTTNLKIGIGLLPVPLRNVALTAMEVASIERLSSGRLIPGVGHGVLDWMGQVGARVESPLTLLREYTVALRALLDGERITSHGRYVNLTDVQLDWPPTPPPPLFAGAGGPKSLALCGELADGVILTGGTTPDQVRAARHIVDDAADAAGRPTRPVLVTFLMAATGPGAEDRLAGELTRWEHLDPTGDIAVAGDVDEIAAAVGRLVAAGADSVILQPTLDEPDVEGFMAFTAQELRSRLGG